MFGACPLYPRKRTLIKPVGMPALCQKQTFAPLPSAARCCAAHAGVALSLGAVKLDFVGLCR